MWCYKSLDWERQEGITLIFWCCPFHIQNYSAFITDMKGHFCCVHPSVFLDFHICDISGVTFEWKAVKRIIRFNYTDKCCHPHSTPLLTLYDKGLNSNRWTSSGCNQTTPNQWVWSCCASWHLEGGNKHPPQPKRLLTVYSVYIRTRCSSATPVKIGNVCFEASWCVFVMGSPETEPCVGSKTRPLTEEEWASKYWQSVTSHFHRVRPHKTLALC